MIRGALVAVVGVALLGATITGAQTSDAEDAAAVVARIGEYVNEYYSVARTIVAREMVTLQPLDADLSESGRARRLTYEMRVEWEAPTGGAAPAATVHRQLLTVDGRSPRPGENAECLSPASPEPLAFLLPGARAEFTFMPPSATRLGRQRAIAIDYVPVMPGTPILEWRGDCGSFELPGLVRGRITVDPDTFAVVQLDQQLVHAVEIAVPKGERRDGWGESITVERADAAIRYEKVAFRDPDETLRLPVEIRHVTEVRTPAMRRLRSVQRFSNYRRFVTNVRIGPVQQPE